MTEEKYEVALSNQGMPSTHEMAVYQTTASHAVSSGLYKSLGGESGIMMIMLAARELKISPILALNGGLQMIQGKLEISARVLNGLIRRSGHTMKIVKSTDDECVVHGIRTDTKEEHTASFTIDDAKRAGLLKSGGGWIKCPKDMCFARAVSRLARQLFPDVIGVGYVEGELSGALKQPTAALSDVTCEEVAVETPQIELDEDSSIETVQSLLKVDDNDNSTQVEEYVKTVSSMFEWTTAKTCNEMMKDPDRLKEKFQKWKKTQKKK